MTLRANKDIQKTIAFLAWTFTRDRSSRRGIHHSIWPNLNITAISHAELACLQQPLFKSLSNKGKAIVQAAGSSDESGRIISSQAHQHLLTQNTTRFTLSYPYVLVSILTTPFMMKADKVESYCFPNPFPWCIKFSLFQFHGTPNLQSHPML